MSHSSLPQEDAQDNSSSGWVAPKPTPSPRGSGSAKRKPGLTAAQIRLFRSRVICGILFLLVFTPFLLLCLASPSATGVVGTSVAGALDRWLGMSAWTIPILTLAIALAFLESDPLKEINIKWALPVLFFDCVLLAARFDGQGGSFGRLLDGLVCQVIGSVGAWMLALVGMAVALCLLWQISVEEFLAGLYVFGRFAIKATRLSWMWFCKAMRLMGRGIVVGSLFAAHKTAKLASKARATMSSASKRRQEARIAREEEIARKEQAFAAEYNQTHAKMFQYMDVDDNNPNDANDFFSWSDEHPVSSQPLEYEENVSRRPASSAAVLDLLPNAPIDATGVISSNPQTQLSAHADFANPSPAQWEQAELTAADKREVSDNRYTQRAPMAKRINDKRYNHAPASRNIKPAQPEEDVALRPPASDSKRVENVATSHDSSNIPSLANSVSYSAPFIDVEEIAANSYAPASAGYPRRQMATQAPTAQPYAATRPVAPAAQPYATTRPAAPAAQPYATARPATPVVEPYATTRPAAPAVQANAATRPAAPAVQANATTRPAAATAQTNATTRPAAPTVQANATTRPAAATAQTNATTPTAQASDRADKSRIVARAKRQAPAHPKIPFSADAMAYLRTGMSRKAFEQQQRNADPFSAGLSQQNNSQSPLAQNGAPISRSTSIATAEPRQVPTTANGSAGSTRVGSAATPTGSWHSEPGQDKARDQAIAGSLVTAPKTTNRLGSQVASSANRNESNQRRRIVAASSSSVLVGNASRQKLGAHQNEPQPRALGYGTSTVTPSTLPDSDTQSSVSEQQPMPKAGRIMGGSIRRGLVSATTNAKLPQTSNAATTNVNLPQTSNAATTNAKLPQASSTATTNAKLPQTSSTVATRNTAIGATNQGRKGDAFNAFAGRSPEDLLHAMGVRRKNAKPTATQNASTGVVPTAQRQFAATDSGEPTIAELSAGDSATSLESSLEPVVADQTNNSEIAPQTQQVAARPRQRYTLPVAVLGRVPDSLTRGSGESSVTPSTPKTDVNPSAEAQALPAPDPIIASPAVSATLPERDSLSDTIVNEYDSDDDLLPPVAPRSSSGVLPAVSSSNEEAATISARHHAAPAPSWQHSDSPLGASHSTPSVDAFSQHVSPATLEGSHAGLTSNLSLGLGTPLTARPNQAQPIDGASSPRIGLGAPKSGRQTVPANMLGRLGTSTTLRSGLQPKEAAEDCPFLSRATSLAPQIGSRDNETTQSPTNVPPELGPTSALPQAMADSRLNASVNGDLPLHRASAQRDSVDNEELPLPVASAQRDSVDNEELPLPVASAQRDSVDNEELPLPVASAQRDSDDNEELPLPVASAQRDSVDNDELPLPVRTSRLNAPVNSRLESSADESSIEHNVKDTASEREADAPRSGGFTGLGMPLPMTSVPRSTTANDNRLPISISASPLGIESSATEKSQLLPSLETQALSSKTEPAVLKVPNLAPKTSSKTPTNVSLPALASSTSGSLLSQPQNSSLDAHETLPIFARSSAPTQPSVFQRLSADSIDDVLGIGFADSSDDNSFARDDSRETSPYSGLIGSALQITNSGNTTGKRNAKSHSKSSGSYAAARPRNGLSLGHKSETARPTSQSRVVYAEPLIESITPTTLPIGKDEGRGALANDTHLRESLTLSTSAKPTRELAKDTHESIDERESFLAVTRPEVDRASSLAPNPRASLPNLASQQLPRLSLPAVESSSSDESRTVPLSIGNHASSSVADTTRQPLLVTSKTNPSVASNRENEAPAEIRGNGSQRAWGIASSNPSVANNRESGSSAEIRGNGTPPALGITSSTPSVANNRESGSSAEILGNGNQPALGLARTQAPLAIHAYGLEIPSSHTKESRYKLPPISLLDGATVSRREHQCVDKSEKLVEALASFGVHARILDVIQGPAVTRYELEPAKGVRVNKFTSLTSDIALALAAKSIRIEAPVPGKSAIGIEVPNDFTDLVVLKDILASDAFHSGKGLCIGLGKDITGYARTSDLSKMPHLLVAGTTGSGKSVCINTLILSLIYKFTPEELQLLMVDPKQVELSIYEGLPHLIGLSGEESGSIVVEPKKAASALHQMVELMEARYTLLARAKVRNIDEYNRKSAQALPWIVIIVDELADLMMAAPKAVETSICRLAQKARAAGIHIVVATQRPSTDVITGLIKVNIPSRIAFAVSSGVDSRVILDSGGAEHLLGKGDMLFKPVDASEASRIQGAFVTNEEIQRVVDFWSQQGLPENRIELEVKESTSEDESDSSNDNPDDDIISDALEVILRNQGASTSMLQTELRIGYSRAKRVINTLERKGYIGPQDGSKLRKIYYTGEEDDSSED